MTEPSILRQIGMVLSVSGATFLSSFSNGSMTVALPTIQKALNIAESNLQWPVSVYALSNGCFLLVSGRLADIFGHRLLFLLGTIWFAIWSLIVAFSPNGTSLIIFMALLGIGPAINTPAGIGILASNLDRNAKNRAFGALAAGYPLGFIVGICLSGVLCQSSASWRSVFYIQSGLSFLSVLLGLVCLPKDTADVTGALKRLSRIDWLGAVIITVALALLSFSLANSQSAPQGWRTPYIPALLGVSILLIGIFVIWERRREQYGQSAIVPLSIFRAPHLGQILLVVFSAWWSFNVLTYFMTLYFQSVLLLRPLDTSVRFIPMAVAGTLFSLGGGLLVGRIRPVLLIISGISCCAAAGLLFALVDIHASYWKMAFPVMILAPALDLAYIVGSIQVVAAVDKSNQALAGGIFNVTSRIGTSVGLAVTSSIANAVSSHYLLTLQPNSQRDDISPPRFNIGKNSTLSLPLTGSSPNVLLRGYRAAAWVCFATAALALVPTIFGLRGLKVVEKNSHSNPEETTDNGPSLVNREGPHELADLSSGPSRIVKREQT